MEARLIYCDLCRERVAELSHDKPPESDPPVAVVVVSRIHCHVCEPCMAKTPISKLRAALAEKVEHVLAHPQGPIEVAPLE